MKITYKIDQLGNAGYMAYCPSMKPVRVFGKTRDEAKRKFPIAIKLYFKKHPDLVKQLESASIEV